MWLASGQMSPGSLLKSPMIHAYCLALILIGTGIELPAGLLATTELLGGIAVPLMLLMLGASLAELSITSFLRPFALSLVRVFGGFTVGFGLASVLRLTPIAAGTFAIQCAMPVAVLTHLFAQKYGGPSKEIAGMILISTGLALASLPVVLLFVR